MPFFLSTFDRVQSKAYRYWFFMYNLLHEYLECSAAKSVACDLTDFKAVEKCFGDGEIDRDATNAEQQTPKLRTGDVISVLKQFIESSNYGEFELRMKILKSFELYVQQSQTKGSRKRRDRITAIIHNLYAYYTQFVNQINETIKTKRSQIEKKLKEFVKIESYNKDLSYFGMKNNVARVHRHLFKFLREFETTLQDKIAEVFVWKANETPPLVDDAPKTKGSGPIYQPNIASYTIDVEHFISAHLKKLNITSTDEYSAEAAANDGSLLVKIDKLFGVSRNVVKNAILHAEFPSLLYKLDMELSNQIETCNYLRGLEVDRTQEKPKQKSQAKHILQQKRKALADCFKLLSTIGLSFRTGLLELSMQSDLVDLKLPVFCLQSIVDATPQHPKLNQSLMQLTKNTDLNFSKCIFKLKLLQMALLTPNPELGLPNFERIKGFTVDMFLLVQRQRQNLCKSTNELQQLQQNIKRINELNAIVASDNANGFAFKAYSVKLTSMENALIRIFDLTEQYGLLLNCVPNDEDKGFTAIQSNAMSAFTQTSERYRQMKTAIASISKSTKNLLTKVQSMALNYFKDSNAFSAVTIEFNRIVSEMHTLCDALKLNTCNEYLVFAKPLVGLLKAVSIETDSNAVNTDASMDGGDNAMQNISNELENIVHHILLAMQNIYKKYSVQKPPNDATIADSNETEPADIEDDQDEENIEKNHLKQKITTEMSDDWQTLNLSIVSNKLSKIIAEIFHSGGGDTKNAEILRKITSISPILMQFELLCKYYLIQQLGAHKVTMKMLSVLLTVFIELTTKGFCIPPDLMQDEDGQQNENGDGKEGEGFGLDDGTGEKDVSDK